MLANYEKMVVISSTSNEWPQNQQIDDDHQKSLMDSTSRAMEKPNTINQEQNQNQNYQESPKCPRCDSSNTKFCYYNNYSLSQPRHFCKACKRYWTRGGTLRNVPVGGGCRKIKRAKRPNSSSTIDTPSSSTLTSPTNPNIQTLTSNHVSPLFYGLPSTNPCDPNLPYQRFNSRVSSYDLQPQLNGLGLGFSSGLIASDHHGFEPITPNSFFSSYEVFGSSNSSPTMASLLSSSLHQQKFMSSNGLKDIRSANSFQGFEPYEDLQIPFKEVKMEESQKRLDMSSVQSQNQMDQIGSTDHSLYWNATSYGHGAWLDPSNLGPSLSSLI